MKYYGKIFCEEGVVVEREFATKAEAEAYVMAFYDALEAIDSDNDFYEAGVGEDPAQEAQ